MSALLKKLKRSPSPSNAAPPANARPPAGASYNLGDFQSIVQAINTFGFRLQNALDPSIPSPALCFPNIYHCFLLLAAGSQSQSFDALANALGFNTIAGSRATQQDREHIMSQFAQLDTYMRSNAASQLLTAASVWHVPEIKLQSSYVEQMTDLFAAKLGIISAQEINSFVREQTKNKITTDFKDQDLKDVDLMLITCLYFKADWATPFDKGMTSRKVFKALDGSSQGQCHMMWLNEKALYHENEVMQLCLLPYKSSSGSESPVPAWQAAVILPKQPGDVGVATVMSQLETQNFTSFISAAQKVQLELSLPRFKFERSQTLNNKLKQLGLGRIFETSTDFEPMTKSTALGVSLVTHDFFIEVNEKGTEVAAKTTIRMTRSMPLRLEVKEMVVDRPFLFVVFDASTRLVLCSTLVTKVSAA